MDHHKHLGLELDSGLTFTKHINDKISIAKSNMDMFFNSSKMLKKWWHQKRLNLKIVILVCCDYFQVISYDELNYVKSGFWYS